MKKIIIAITLIISFDSNAQQPPAILQVPNGAAEMPPPPSAPSPLSEPLLKPIITGNRLIDTQQTKAILELKKQLDDLKAEVDQLKEQIK